MLRTLRLRAWFDAPFLPLFLPCTPYRGLNLMKFVVFDLGKRGPLSTRQLSPVLQDEAN